MKLTRKIGWQKYEDVIEKQINSPLVEMFMNTMSIEGEIGEFNELVEYNEEEELDDRIMINIPEALTGEISLISNFDCWIGHTNFNLTDKIKNILNKVDGVDALKICSRYRFFIGVGRMFKFSDVRKDIERTLIKGDKIE